MKIDNELDVDTKETRLLFNPYKNRSGKKNRQTLVTELAEELAGGHTKFGRSNDELKEMITSRFQANYKK